MPPVVHREAILDMLACHLERSDEDSVLYPEELMSIPEHYLDQFGDGSTKDFVYMYLFAWATRLADMIEKNCSDDLDW